MDHLTQHRPPKQLPASIGNTECGVPHSASSLASVFLSHSPLPMYAAGFDRRHSSSVLKPEIQQTYAPPPPQKKKKLLPLPLLLSSLVMINQEKNKSAEMSKLSTSLKALINAPFAKPGPRPAPGQIAQLFESIAQDASKKNLSPKSWLTLSVCEVAFSCVFS